MRDRGRDRRTDREKNGGKMWERRHKKNEIIGEVEEMARGEWRWGEYRKICSGGQNTQISY